MRITQIAASCVFLTIAGAVLALSLSSPTVRMGSNYRASSTQQPLAKLVSNTLLPGHPFYLGYMLRDRVQLWLTKEPMDKLLLEMEYADSRLNSAVHLFDRNEFDLGITTAAKAEMYLVSAAEDLRTMWESGVRDEDAREQLLEKLQVHSDTLEIMHEQVFDTERPRIRELIIRNDILSDIIKNLEPAL